MENRVISVSLKEQEWQAFIRLHPQPVVWLREKIQESLAGGNAAAIAPASAAGAANTTSATKQ
jgi:hypothetical protein